VPRVQVAMQFTLTCIYLSSSEFLTPHTSRFVFCLEMLVFPHAPGRTQLLLMLKPKQPRDQSGCAKNGNTEESHLVRLSCWREVLSNACDLHILETLPWRDCRSREHRLSQFPAHEFAMRARPPRHINRGLGSARRRLRPKGANQDEYMYRHR
jgi:hypothetical protein